MRILIVCRLLWGARWRLRTRGESGGGHTARNGSAQGRGREFGPDAGGTALRNSTRTRRRTNNVILFLQYFFLSIFSYTNLGLVS